MTSAVPARAGSKPNGRAHHASRTCSGLTLVELMVGITVALLLLSALMSFLVTHSKANRDLLHGIRLEQELRATLDFMVRDISRAGYWRDAHLDIGASDYCNPAYASACIDEDDAQVFALTTSMIRYGYDPNGIGTPALFGFRLQSGTLQYLANNQWQSLNDVTTTRYSQFVVTPTTREVEIANGKTIRLREIELSATAFVPAAPSVSRSVTRRMRVRNDELVS